MSADETMFLKQCGYFTPFTKKCDNEYLYVVGKHVLIDESLIKDEEARAYTPN
jgi:hypothetical protein